MSETALPLCLRVHGVLEQRPANELHKLWGQILKVTAVHRAGS